LRLSLSCTLRQQRKSCGRECTASAEAGVMRIAKAVFVFRLMVVLLSVSCAWPATRTVNISNFAFTDTVSNNSTSTINEGDTIHWVWQSGTHSTTSGTCSGPGTCTPSGTWDSTILSAPNTFDFTFNSSGTFPYYCRVHTTAMLAKVIVNPVVTNTNDSGAGSLRQAILDANADPDLTQITFNIPGLGIHTIIPISALPALTRPVILDAYTQPGSTPGTPVIELDGASAGGSTVGLSVQGGNTTVRGLVINRFAQGGIVLQSSGNTITGNFIGTNAAGNSASANGGDGVLISGGQFNNTVGGTTAATRNVISGNGLFGIQIAGLGTNGNVVEGNFIGTNVTGTVAIANSQDGIRIQSGAANNIIGGISAGAGNVISGNVGNGIVITGGGTTGNIVLGNFIGSNAAGTAALANGQNGILMNNTASNNSIGGQIAGAGNVISGNTGAGIAISDASTAGNGIQGNLIGTNAAGAAAIANATGVILENGASGNLIGGTTSAARNVISGNGSNGVLVTGGGTTGNTVAANFIGINAAGTASLGNAPDGVLINNGASANTIGSVAAGAGNVISGNAGAGISISDSGTSNNQVFGNLIGTNPAGNGAFANSNGVLLVNNTSNNTIGGANASQRNIISGNTSTGVTMNSVTGIVLAGNFIGTDVNGTGALGNSVGVFLVNNATGNFVGQTGPGGGNIISGNSADGVEISGTNFNMVTGNFIGTDSTGGAAIANGVGVYLTAAAGNNTIGGTSANARNVISGNASYGVLLQAVGTSANTVQGNFIGTDASGAVALGNGGAGITLFNGPAGNIIGGASAGAGNVISGNANDGVSITGAGSVANIVQGNLIGTNAAGAAALANSNSGVSILSGATSNTIGGATVAARNLISGNVQHGVVISGLGSSGNVVEGNDIGTDILATGQIGNHGDGVRIDTGAANNQVGVGGGNIIAFNAKGVVVTGTGSTGDMIEGNSIFSNTALGIDLADDGVTLNDASGHSGPNNFQNYPVLTSAVSDGTTTHVIGTLNSAANTSFHVEFFGIPACDPSGHGQGINLLGASSVSTDSTGAAPVTFSFSTSLIGSGFVSATATDPAGNTSEFSACQHADSPPINVVGRQLRVRLGQPFTLVIASFTDPDPSGVASQFSATSIDWGDGTAPTTATIVPLGSENYNVVGTHAYTKVGSWNVTVTIKDSGGAGATANSKVRLWPKAFSF
jgi:titin